MKPYLIPELEKQAFVGAIASILATLAMPSVNKRLVQNTFEMSKKKALGLSIEKETEGVFGWLAKRVNKDLDSVEKMPKGFRKGLNKLLMNEGPSAILYAPAKTGRELGTALNQAAKEAPFARKFLGDITSVDTSKARKAMEKLTKLLKKAKGPKVITGASAIGGGLGTYLLAKAIPKNEGA